MFKLESYVTPLLMGYIDQYVALKQEDFQLSLWGGDAVLNKLDLRLDVIEKAIHLPITFKSGHIHELRLHVPWTALGSEPVIITINTIECILKLRDSAHDDASSQASSKKTKDPATKRDSKRNRNRALEEPDLPPGYIQGLINRILNNVNIVVNNLILKFVEDDIVLSVNVKSAECYSVNSNWMRDFVDLAMPDLALRRVIDFSDLTICLDKRNASGKIETYQDPLLYRCPVTCRMHSQYDGLYSKYPSVTKINFLCEKLDISLTDTQLPMFFRLMELCIAIYYGTLQLPEASPSEPSEADFSEAKHLESSVDPPSDIEMVESEPNYEEAPQSWTSWAWSYVPQILPTEDDFEYEDEEAVRAKRKNEPSALVVGFCVNKGSVIFKLTEHVSQSEYFGLGKVNFKPCMVWYADGISMEAIIRGLDFFDVQFGVTSTRMEFLGQSISGNKDTEDPFRNPVFFSSGSSDTDPGLKVVNFTTNSLFDPGGAENAGEKAEYIFDQEKHAQLYTETYGLHKYGALWMDYLYVMERNTENRAGSSRSSASGTSDEFSEHKENSCMRFLIGPAQLTVSSSMVQRLHKFVHCAQDHEYEPYSKPPSDEVEELRAPPTEEEVNRLEEFVATRSQHFTFLQPRITLMAADLPEYDVTKKLRATVAHGKHKKKPKGQTPETPPVVSHKPVTLPCMLVQAERVDIQLTTAMYPKHLVKTVSALASPSKGLIHHCHSHTYLKLFGLSGGISALDPSSGFLGPQTLLQPLNSVYYFKRLLLPQYWKNPLQPKTESVLEVQQFSLSSTLPQIFFCIHIGQTWTQNSPSPEQLEEYSLLNDIFRPTKQWPLLQLTLTGIGMKRCCTEAALAYSATLSTLQTTIIHSEDGMNTVTPIVYGPLRTNSIHSLEFFTHVDSPSSTECHEDLINATWQIPSNPIMPQAHAAVFLNIQGIVGCFDPILSEWLTYKPRTVFRPRSTLSPDTRTSQEGIPHGEKSPTPQAPKGSHSHDNRSDSTVTVPTGSQTHSQTYNHTHGSSRVKAPEVSEPKSAESASSPEKSQENTWGALCAKLYPLMKIIQVQVDINNWCAFLPSKHLQLSHPTLNIPHNLHQEYFARGLPPLLVISCPRVRVCSAGHKPVSPIQEIPIRALEHSVAGEKLPWSVKLSNCSVYTITESQMLQHWVKPLGVSATLAVTTKYHPPTSDNITSLGLCIHADMDTTALACSKPQVNLAYRLMMDYCKVAWKMLDSFQVLAALNCPVVTPTANPTPPSKPDPAAKTQAASTGTPPKTIHKITSMSSMLDQGPEPGLMSITETSDTFSVCPSPCDELEEEGGVKLSLWMQITLPKFTAKVYSENALGQALCLLCELEDLSSAIDIHPVYAKIKCKAGSFNIFHKLKKSPDKWEAGSLQGILLSCTDQVAQPLHLVTHRTWQPPSAASIPNLFHSEEQKPCDHGFISLTFTRAQRKNVKRKMKKANIEGMFDFEKRGDMTFRDEGLVYLNEVCLNIEPCDVVMNCPVIASVVDVFCMGLVSPEVKPKSAPRKSSSNQSPLPLLTSSILPLVYMSVAKFRVFVPTCASSSADTQDLCVMQINGINVQPHADNPLSRIVQDKEVYKLATQVGILNLPGSQVEDRQYQLDIHALSLATGCWQDVVKKGKHPSHSLSREPAVQNPALEWNMQGQSTDEPTDVKLIPIAAPFDLRIVAAPAVVYIPKDNPSNATIVCGHSLEVNATSEMEYYLSLDQMSLFSRIFNTNITPLINNLTATSHQRPGHKNYSDWVLVDETNITHDSGVESEASTFTTVLTSSKPKPSTVESVDIHQQWANITPFHVLFTAGKISFMIYGHEPLDPESFSHSSSPHSSEFELVKKPGLKISSGSFQEACSVKVCPYLYLFISQPHTWMSCIPNGNQKLELSCFDLMFKGAKPKTYLEEEGKFIPDASDFNVPWLETRPGKPQHQTGIPPSLLTLHVTDFLQQQGAGVELMLERPLKLNFSISKVQQILALSELLTAELKSMSVAPEAKTKEHSPEPSPPGDAATSLSLLSYIKAFHFHTVQVVVSMETIPDPHAPMVTLSITGMETDVNLHSSKSGEVSSIETSLSVHNLQLKTSYALKLLPLMGPCSPAFHIQATWGPHGGPKHLPVLLIYIDCGLLKVQLGQENILCLDLIHQHLTSFVQFLSPAASGPMQIQTLPSSKKSDTPSKSHPLSAADETTDDLRAGSFVYVTENVTLDELPRPLEIMFGYDYDTGNASMSWCYPLPRVLTHLSVTPVPFTMPRPLEADRVDETLAVPCTLQYYNLLTRGYEDYAEFSLSENTSCDLRLPQVKGHDPYTQVAVSQLWRVLIHKSPVKSENEYEEEEEEKSLEEWLEPLVSPMTLAASIRVDSCLVAGLIPSMQCAVHVGSVELSLWNHFAHLGKATPSRLYPFEIYDSSIAMDQEVLKLNLNTLTLNASVLCSPHQLRVSAHASTVVKSSIVEYRNMTRYPLLDITSVLIKGLCHSKEESMTLKADMTLGSISLQVGQAAVHSLNAVALTWNQLGCGESTCRIIPNHYIICNDTQEAIKIRQMDTDECVVISSREALPYSWRSPVETQMLQLSVESMPGAWTESTSLDVCGTYVRTVEKAGQKATLVVRTRSITNVQMQVIISGAVTVASRLSQSLEVKLMSQRSVKTSNCHLKPGQALSSFVCTCDDIKALRVRLSGPNAPWSQEIVVRDISKESKLVKLSTHEKETTMHVWCHIFTQIHQDSVTSKEHARNLDDTKHVCKLVLFTPLFIVRNKLPAPLLMNIQTPRLKAFTQLELEGQGLERQLHMMGGDITHSITYQLSPQMKPSSPPVALSSGLIEQVNAVGVDSLDVDQMAYQWGAEGVMQWPYNQLQEDRYTHRNQQVYHDIIIPQTPSSNPNWMKSSSKSGDTNSSSPYPDIELQIMLSQRWAGCNTVLIDVVPYMLIVNQTPLDLKIFDDVAEEDWTLPTNKTFAPPHFQGAISFGILLNNYTHTSDSIMLSEEDNQSRYLPALPDILYLNGHLSLAIPIRHSGRSQRVCYLAIHSANREGIRILTITEKFCISNWSPFPYLILPYSLKIGQKVKLIHDSEEAVFTPSSKLQAEHEECVPLLFWETAREESEEFSGDYVQYITIKHSESGDNRLSHQGDWSHPTRLSVNTNGSRQTLSVTLQSGPRSQRTKCMTMTCQEQHCIVYLTLREDKEPPIHLHNNCGFPLYFGQSFTSKEVDTGATVQEEKELITSLPVVPPFSMMYYAFPDVNANYPELQSPSSLNLRLHLGGVPLSYAGASLDQPVIYWSTPLDLASEHATFAQIPDVSDIKVQVAHEGNTTHVYVDPVSRAEISAKEIRSRIKGKEKVRMEQMSTSLVDELAEAAAEKGHEVTSEPEEVEVQADPTERYFDINVLCTQVTAVLLDDTKLNKTKVTELLCVTADNVGFSCYPKLDYARSTSAKPKYDQCVVFCVGDMQIDNQLYGVANFDFPVVLMSAKPDGAKDFMEEAQFSGLSFEERLGVIMNKGIMCFTCGFYRDLRLKSLTLQSLILSMKPLQIFAEDRFIYELLKEIDRMIPTKISDDLKPAPKHRALPSSVRITACALNQPIRLENLCIEPIEMLVSLHASLKVFLASDNTPLKFGKFERTLFTSSQQLARSLTMHYASGALFRAGLVVGSLEILGNPTGLVRHFSQGVSDLFRMPYQGLMRGPGAFIGGVTRGMGSLLRHVSTGTLNSITDFASSISRNMERLSLDAEHAERQELSRRQKPTGVSQGFINGLSGFGISLLGAIAGIADQPLQSLTRTAPSRTRAATGLVSGVGKGLMGVVTKPIGGAAELVSQTGMGLMQGAGLARFPSVRHAPREKNASEFPGSQIKVLQKLLPSGANASLLAVLPARYCPPAHPVCAVLLLLTPEVLFVVDEFGDTQEQAYAMADISCLQSGADPSVVFIVPKASTKNGDADGDKQNDISSKDRVAQFIAMGSGHDPTSSQSGKRNDSPQKSVQHKFLLVASAKELFLAIFEQAQRKLKGHGFAV